MIFGAQSFTDGAVTFAPDPLLPGHVTCSAWPQLAIKSLTSYSDIDNCNGLLLRIDPGGPHGVYVFLTGNVYRRAVESGLYSTGLRLTNPQGVARKAPVWEFGEPRPTRRTTSPAGYASSHGVMLGLEPGAERLYPLSTWTHMWGVVTTGDGCGISRNVEPTETDANYGGPASAPDYGPFAGAFAQFGGPPVGLGGSYAVIGKYVRVPTRQALQARRLAFLATFTNAKASERAALEFDAQLELVSPLRVDTIAIPFVSHQGRPFYLPTRGFERRLGNGHWGVDNSFVPRPPLRDEAAIDAWERQQDVNMSQFAGHFRGTGVLTTAMTPSYPIYSCEWRATSGASSDAPGVSVTDVYSSGGFLFVSGDDDEGGIHVPLHSLAGLFPRLETVVASTAAPVRIQAFASYSLTGMYGEANVLDTASIAAFKAKVMQEPVNRSSEELVTAGCYGSFLPFVDEFAVKVDSAVRRGLASLL